ncbi:MAG: glycosyltransferase family 4 protein, partial [Bryobacteraceae bacterium]
GWRTIWSEESIHELRNLLGREKPDIAHFHNTFPLISPSGYSACREAGVPVVQTLHNFRMLCPGGNLFRDGQVCEECVEHNLLCSLVHGCYRDSRMATAVVAGMLAVHRGLGTWKDSVDLFLVPTEFAGRKLAAGGIPAWKIAIKPNFAEFHGAQKNGKGARALFVGRISPEKGVGQLTEAWARMGGAVPLEIVGDGPQRASLEAQCSDRGMRGVTWSGWQSREMVFEKMREARFLFVPSACYEMFPLAIVDAFACGVPVIAANHGAMAELVSDGVTGLHFRSGDAADLADKALWAWNHPQEMVEMGRAARAEFEEKYTPRRNCRLLEKAYERAIGSQE